MIIAAAGLIHYAQSKSNSSPVKTSTELRPVPEFARVARVILPAGLFESNYHADQLATAIRNAEATVDIAGNFGEAYDGITVTINADHTNIWLRDYSPIPVTEGNKLFLRGFNYSSAEPENNTFGPNLANSLHLMHQQTSLPLEGGNFLTDGTRCYIAGNVEGTETPAQIPSAEGAKQDLGCEDLIVIQNPPHVHIDMFAKVLNADTVAVNELDNEALDLTRDADGNLPDDLEELRTSLDQAAQQFSRYLNVVRLPMPLPFKNAFRTYANGILVNGTAILPAFEQYGWSYGSYPDSSVLADIQKRAAEVYEAQGFETVFVNADGLIYNGGAFHCVSTHIPETE